MVYFYRKNLFKDWQINGNIFISFIELKGKKLEISFFMEIDILMLNFILKDKHARRAKKTLEKKIYRDGQALQTLNIL